MGCFLPVERDGPATKSRNSHAGRKSAAQPKGWAALRPYLPQQALSQQSLGQQMPGQHDFFTSLAVASTQHSAPTRQQSLSKAQQSALAAAAQQASFVEQQAACTSQQSFAFGFSGARPGPKRVRPT